MEIKDIIELMKAASEHGLTGFELEQGDMKLVMKREKRQIPQTAEILPAGGSAVEAPAKELSSIPEGVYADHVVTSPLVGTFYSSPSPDAENYVKVGDHVKKGQVIGIVEAMKLMNEIESEYDGVVEAILVKNEETVEYGQPLFRIH